MNDTRELARRRLEMRSGAIRFALIWMTLAATPSGLFVYASIRNGPPWWVGLCHIQPILALVVLAVVANSMISLVWSSYFGATICPYFEREVGGIDTFANGHALARQFEELDALAGQLGVSSLSEFGFADDLEGETVVWHDPADGLVTVDALIAALSEAGVEMRQKSRILADLRRVADALEKAREKGIRFSLLYRLYDLTSGLEWERRKGTCF